MSGWTTPRRSAARCSASSIWVRARFLTIDTEAGRLRLRAPNQVRAEIGELVGLAFQPDRLLLFDPSTERALASDLVPEAAGHG